jgi:outer membrane biosynthesis protein TonB
MDDAYSKPLGRDASRTSTDSASGASWVSVDELLAHQIAVDWSEAVALLAELCAVLSGRGDMGVPHAADVLVNDQGALAIRAQEVGQWDSAALGRMLHSLSTNARTTAPLRLFVSQAISSDRYQSVSAFAEALSSYEVPGRNKLIQAVHHRWIATRAGAASPAPIPLRLEREREQEEKPQATPNARVRRLPRWAIAIAGVAIVVGGAAGAWLATGATPLSMPSVSLSIPTAVARAIPAAINDALRWLGTHTPGDMAAVRPETTEPRRARGTRTRTFTARPRTSDPNPVLDPAIATELTESTPATGSVTAIVPNGETVTTGGANDIPVPAAVTVSPAPIVTGGIPGPLDDVAADNTVYSIASPDVVPPVMMPRQLTPPEAQTSGVKVTSTIELLVDESGGVERVRLLSRPSPILATMLLSAAKTWKFRPALNDGRAVKYRLLIDVVTARP